MTRSRRLPQRPLRHAPSAMKPPPCAGERLPRPVERAEPASVGLDPTSIRAPRPRRARVFLLAGAAAKPGGAIVGLEPEAPSKPSPGDSPHGPAPILIACVPLPADAPQLGRGRRRRRRARLRPGRSAASSTSISARRRSPSGSVALKHEDYVITTYRDVVLALAKGMGALQTLMAGASTERSIWCSQGLGGSMHLFDRENNIPAATASSAGTSRLRPAAAFASKYRGGWEGHACSSAKGSADRRVPSRALLRLRRSSSSARPTSTDGDLRARCRSRTPMKALGTGWTATASSPTTCSRSSGGSRRRSRARGSSRSPRWSRCGPTAFAATDERSGEVPDAAEPMEHKQRDPLNKARTSSSPTATASRACSLQLEDAVEAETQEAVTFAEQYLSPGRRCLRGDHDVGPFAS